MKDLKSRRLTTLCVGHVTHDKVGEVTLPGGSAWYGARACLALDARSRLATTVGQDFEHDLALAGLEVSAARRGKTTTFQNRYLRKGGREMRVLAQAAPVRPVLNEPWVRPDVAILLPVLGEVDLAAWRALLKPGLLAVGLQGWLKRKVRGRAVPSPAALDPADFEGVDLACLSEEDLGGDLAWYKALVKVVPIVALTKGRRGCRLTVRGMGTHLATAPVQETDPTGAGDTFCAALALHLARGVGPWDATLSACRSAAEVVQREGALG